MAGKVILLPSNLCNKNQMFTQSRPLFLLSPPCRQRHISWTCLIASAVPLSVVSLSGSSSRGSSPAREAYRGGGISPAPEPFQRSSSIMQRSRAAYTIAARGTPPPPVLPPAIFAHQLLTLPTCSAILLGWKLLTSKDFLPAS